MKTITIFSIKHLALLVLLTIGLILTNVETTVAQTDTSDVEYANTTLVPAPLKICSVAGQGVAVGTPFTFTITTPGATTGLRQSFTSTRVILAGPASTGSAESQNGYCDYVTGPFTDLDGVAGGARINGIGSFNVGSMVTVQQTNQFSSDPFATFIATISSATSPIVIGSTTGSATLTIINGVNEVAFVSTVIGVVADGDGFFGPTKRRKRVRFF